MENIDKGITVPKWVLIVWPKIPKMPQNLSDQYVCPSPKVLDFSEKRLHWASVVRGNILYYKVLLASDYIQRILKYAPLSYSTKVFLLRNRKELITLGF